MSPRELEKLPLLLTIRQVAQILNVHPDTLRDWDRQGRLKALRLGPRRDRRYRKEDILRVIQRGI